MPKLLIQVNGRVVEALLDTFAQKSFLSSENVKKYFYYKKIQVVDVNVLAAANQTCKITGPLKMEFEIRNIKFDWTFLAMDGMGCNCTLGIDILKFTGAQVNFPEGLITFENLDENIEKVHENVKIN